MFSNLWSAEEISDQIRDIMAVVRGVEVEEGYIQIRLQGLADTCLGYKEEKRLTDMLTEDNFLFF